MIFRKLHTTVLFLSLFSLLTIFSHSYTQDTQQDKHIVVIAASYNNKDWYKKHIDSFAMQDYQNKTMIYVDDKSPDNTGNLVETYIKEKNLEEQIVLIKNETRFEVR